MSQHTLHAYIQANIWSQDVIISQQSPFHATWGKGGDRLSRDLLSEKQAAPEAVVELIWCNWPIQVCVHMHMQGKQPSVEIISGDVWLWKRVSTTTLNCWWYQTHQTMRVMKEVSNKYGMDSYMTKYTCTQFKWGSGLSNSKTLSTANRITFPWVSRPMLYWYNLTVVAYIDG